MRVNVTMRHQLIVCFWHITINQNKVCVCVFFVFLCFIWMTTLFFLHTFLCLGVLPSLEASTLSPAITFPTLPPHSCQPGQFACGNYGECVSQNQVCDFRQDCSDGSDEKGCGMSVFISITPSIYPSTSIYTSVPPVSLYISQNFLVMKRCNFEGGKLCEWKLDNPKPPVPLHAFQWLIGQGETIYHGEEHHRPVNDHTL